MASAYGLGLPKLIESSLFFGVKSLKWSQDKEPAVHPPIQREANVHRLLLKSKSNGRV